MEKPTRFMNKLVVLFSLLLLSACGETALKEETFHVQEENKVWLADAERGDTFIMKDNNGISLSFRLEYEQQDFDQSDGYLMGVHTDRTLRERYYQDFSTHTHTHDFSIYVNSLFEEDRDELAIYTDGLSFNYDLKAKTLYSVNIESTEESLNWISYHLNENGEYETDDEFIQSFITFEDTLTVAGKTYEGILHFKLKDFEENWQPYTITNVWMAENYGLLKFTYHNGLSYERQAK